MLPGRLRRFSVAVLLKLGEAFPTQFDAVPNVYPLVEVNELLALRLLHVYSAALAYPMKNGNKVPKRT